MISAALLSMLISNTSTTLIMMPMALAVLAGGGMREGDTDGLSGALPMGIALAASIRGPRPSVGPPPKRIAGGLPDHMIGGQRHFVTWGDSGLAGADGWRAWGGRGGRASVD